MATTTLYRFFGKNDELIYIGITNSIPRRFDQHETGKPWFTEAARITVEHHPNRGAALAAEKAAIIEERPKYNIQHNRRGREKAAARGAKPGRWTFESHRSGYERSVDLYLYGELECSAMVDEVYELDGEGQLTEYVLYLKSQYPQWLQDDAVPIFWSVMGDGVCENAPFQSRELWTHAHFLNSFTWPYDAKTFERLDWFRLPVRQTRFPEFSEALGWTPAPLQPYCPLRSIMASRDGIAPAAWLDSL